MELRQLIEEQHTVVCETYLSGSRLGSSTEESGIRNCMMRAPKRPSRHEPILTVQQTANAGNFRCLNCFAQRERRKNRWDPLRDHRFTRARRPYAKECCSPVGQFFTEPAPVPNNFSTAGVSRIDGLSTSRHSCAESKRVRSSNSTPICSGPPSDTDFPARGRRRWRQQSSSLANTC